MFCGHYMVIIACFWWLLGAFSSISRPRS